VSINFKKDRIKTAIIVSPQTWGKMFISKHHYAVELSKLGYKVFFINPPKEMKIGSWFNLSIEKTAHENLWVLSHTFFFSSYIKFHLPWLFNRLVYIQRWFVLRKTGTPDIILSFDLSNNFPLNGLNCRKIFFSADEPKGKQNFLSAKNANLIVSVSQHILDLFKSVLPSIPQLLINHGLSEEFLNIPENLSKKYEGINVGLSGNFLFNDIDYPKLFRIIKMNPTITFHFYGSHLEELSNIGSSRNLENHGYLEKIKNLSNTVFHGVLTKKDLAFELHQMDAFLICYDPINGQSSGSNSHKILEFLSTGKVIYSTYFSYYSGRKDLLEMTINEKMDETLLFSNLTNLNNAELKKNRKEFAEEHTYSLNCKKILLDVGCN
jgi:hypothetical protein